MDEKTTMGQPLRSMEDEETIDLMELARLLWAHIVQIVAAAVAAALICLLVCMFALTPKYQASINMIVNTRQDNSSTFTSDNFNSAKNLISTYAVIIKGNTVLNEVIDTLDLDMTYGKLYKMVEVTSVDSTQIIRSLSPIPMQSVQARSSRPLRTSCLMCWWKRWKPAPARR